MHKIFEGIELTHPPYDYGTFIMFKADSYASQALEQQRQGNLPQAFYCMALCSFCVAVGTLESTGSDASERAYYFFRDSAAAFTLTRDQWVQIIHFIGTDRDIWDWIPKIVDGTFRTDLGI